VSNLRLLQERLDYTFREESLLRLALTHPSLVHEAPGNVQHNQRLEFLGDAVLGLVLTGELYEKFPSLGEGPLTKARAQMVNRRTLAAEARTWLEKSARPGAALFAARLVARLDSVQNRLASARSRIAQLSRACFRDAGTRTVAWLSGAGVAMVLLADLSQMSRAEVERIWLPFVPWLLLSCALLPEPWRRRGLVVQVVLALAVQHLLFTGW